MKYFHITVAEKLCFIGPYYRQKCHGVEIQLVCVSGWRTHLHGEDSDVVPADLFSVQWTHRHQWPGSDFDVEVLLGITGPLDGISVDTKWHVPCDVSAWKKSAVLCVFLKLVILSHTNAPACAACVYQCDKMSGEEEASDKAESEYLPPLLKCRRGNTNLPLLKTTFTHTHTHTHTYTQRRRSRRMYSTSSSRPWSRNLFM